MGASKRSDAARTQLVHTYVPAYSMSFLLIIGGVFMEYRSSMFPPESHFSSVYSWVGKALTLMGILGVLVANGLRICSRRIAALEEELAKRDGNGEGTER